MRSSLTLKYFSKKKKFQGCCLEEQQNIYSSGNNNKAYSVIPWVLLPGKKPALNDFHLLLGFSSPNVFKLVTNTWHKCHYTL